MVRTILLICCIMVTLKLPNCVDHSAAISYSSSLFPNSLTRRWSTKLQLVMLKVLNLVSWKSTAKKRSYMSLLEVLMVIGTVVTPLTWPLTWPLTSLLWPRLLKKKQKDVSFTFNLKDDPKGSFESEKLAVFCGHREMLENCDVMLKKLFFKHFMN